MFKIKYPIKRLAALILTLLVFAAYSLPSGAGSTADMSGSSNEPFNFFAQLDGESDDFIRDAIKIINANRDDAYFMTIQMELGKNELTIDGESIGIDTPASLDANGEVLLPIGEINAAIDIAAGEKAAAADNAADENAAADNAAAGGAPAAKAPAGSAASGPASSTVAPSNRAAKKTAAVMSADGEIKIVTEGDQNPGVSRLKGASASGSAQAACSASDAEKKYGFDVSRRGEKIIISKPYQLKQLILYIKDGRSLANFRGASDYATNGKGAYFLQFADENAARAAYRAYAADARVQYVSVNHMVSSCAMEDRWGAEAVYSEPFIKYLDDSNKTAEPLIVAVLDTGVDVSHELLENRTVPGWNFDEENDDPYDAYGHGTHVSGIIADNSPANVKIMPIKTLDDWGFYANAFALSNSIAYAADNGAKVISMSLRGYCDEEDCINLQAVDYALAKGALSVVAAGNESDDASHYCPSKSYSAVTVAASDINDDIAWFSNYGPCVDIAAPGVDVLSSIPDNQYMYMSGTSMATPFVSAGVAMLMLEYPDYSPQEIKEKLKTLIYGFKENYWVNYGAGILDFYSFFNGNQPGIRLFTKDIYINAIQQKYRQYNIRARIMPGGLEDKTLSYASDNPDVAVCDENGVILIKGEGTAKITVTSNAHGMSGTMTVTVDTDESSYWIGSAADVFAGGDGTQNNPYLISTPEQLALMAKIGCSEGSGGRHIFENAYLELTNDIDLYGKDWYSIGGVFAGSFNGNGHVIKNMRQTYTKYVDFWDNGFFDALNYAEIRNLGIIDAYVEKDGKMTGILSGAATASLIESCYTTGETNGGALLGWGGGMTVFTWDGEYTTEEFYPLYISNCYSTAKSDGFVNNANAVNINNSYYQGDNCFIDYTYNWGGPTNGVISNCYMDNLGSDSACFIRIKDATTIKNCFYRENGNTGILNDYSPWDTDLKARPIEFFLDAGSYSDADNWDSQYPWDFTHAWGMDENINGGLPYLLFKVPLLVEQAGAPYFYLTDARFGKTLNIYSETKGAEIYYTFDGYEPDRSSFRYTGKIWFMGAGTYTVNAIAIKRGMEDSQATGIVFTVDPTEAPTADKTPGLVNRGTAVTLSCATPGAVIYYTTDGSYPYENSEIYKTPIIINKDTTILAVACKPGNEPSEAVEFTYKIIQLQAMPPWFTIVNVINGKDIYLKTMTEDADIYYTLDGSNPAVSGELYAGCIEMYEADKITIKAIAVKEGLKPSQTASLTVVVEQVAWVKADRGSGYVDAGTAVDLSSATPGAAVYYTTDGSEPDENSDVLTSPIIIAGNTHIRAKAYKNGMAASETRDYKYMVAPAPGAEPSKDAGPPKGGVQPVKPDNAGGGAKEEAKGDANAGSGAEDKPAAADGSDVPGAVVEPGAGGAKPTPEPTNDSEKPSATDKPGAADETGASDIPAATDDASKLENADKPKTPETPAAPPARKPIGGISIMD